MQIDAGMDTGPTLLRREVQIGPDETEPELASRLRAIGADLVAESLLQFDGGEISPAQQDSKNATYAPILKKEDGRIGWARTAGEIYNRMRGFTPWPGAYSTFRAQTCQIWGRPEAAHEAGAPIAVGEIVSTSKEIHVVCGERTYLRLESVQMEGRKKVSAREFANGSRLASGDRFA